MTSPRPRLPLGYQDFKSLRNDGCLYVDKTDILYNLVNDNGKSFFLSRPRRFGKSLLLSTLKYYWEGRKDLFEGLAIAALEQDWNPHAVIHIDMNRVRATNANDLEEDLKAVIGEEAKRLEIEVDLSRGLGVVFGDLIRRASEKTGRGVVLLFDEYDKGLLETIHEGAKLERNTDILRNLFVQLKACDEFIKFALITGVARFSHLTLFSGVNNLVDISMNPSYATLCGITEDEMRAYFPNGIKLVAQRLGCDTEDAVLALRQRYNGYRFTAEPITVYNPFNLLQVMSQGIMNDYWARSGSSKTLVEYLKRSSFTIEELSGSQADEIQLASIFDEDNPLALLYQTGYLTIVGVRGPFYTLDIPNAEVRNTLVKELFPLYLGVDNAVISTTLRNFMMAVWDSDVEAMMTTIQSLIAKIPNEIMHRNPLEETFHMLVYEIFLLVGIDTESERSVSSGRIDMVATTLRDVYVFEFKLGGTPEEVLAQIDSKEYALSWNADHRRVYKIGAVFSPETRTLSSWLIEH
ncbi:MAG: ATP-binding protein [Bacteroidales bacterium]|nr:ATP-binding protein [Bacteroidales bacterium]